MHHSPRRLTRFSAALVAASLSVVGLAACGSGDGSADGANTSPVSEQQSNAGDSGATQAAGKCGTDEDITLTVGLFGTFGFKEAGLYKAYQQRCPNITIKQDVVEQAADYWTRLKTRLASGSGLDDVQAIEIGFVSDVVQNHADQFVNWADLPETAQLKSMFYDWKWQQASSADGSFTAGLGTDIGPEAICYRPDLLKQAGLPSDPQTLAKKWQTWQGFIDFGKKYQASSTTPDGSHFVDSSASIYSAAVYQGDQAYANKQGEVAVKNSDGVKTAWKYATQAAEAGISAGLEQFSPDWNKAFSGKAFATLACPAWMMGYIKSQAGKSYAGKWAIAPVLPGGAANWGGSWLGVPTAAEHKQAAIAFVEWLSQEKQQVTMWTAGGHFPSNKNAAQNPKVKNATSDYFSNAPVGKIFGQIASKMSMPPVSPYDSQVAQAFTTQLTNIENRGTPPDEAFDNALENVSRITG